jgi:cysteine desulfurase
VAYSFQVRSIYFDYNATTPLDPLVREAMLPFLDETFGNPSSIHHLGRKARATLDEARERTARVLGCKPGEITFTSGGTESNNLAILGTARLLRSKGRHLITSPVEHHAVLHCFEHLVRQEEFQLSLLPVDQHGVVNPDDLKRSLRSDTTLVSVMAANNETGAVQPIAELGRICREHGVFFHTDAVQWFGKMPFADIHQFNADLVSICAHKFHGPKGAGALFSRSPLLPAPLFFGGGHENERRPGTENLPSIVGFTESLERFITQPVFSSEKLVPFSACLSQAAASIDGVFIRSQAPCRLANTVAFTVSSCDSISLLAALDLEGICASSGSACSAGSLTPSHVLSAMGVPADLANSFVRFSLGRESSADEIESVASILPVVINRVRSA